MGSGPNERRLFESLSEYCRHRWSLRFLDGNREMDRFVMGLGKFASDGDPDMILVDKDTLDAGGWELLRKLRVSFRLSRIPVVAISSRIVTADLEKAKELDVVLMAKPQGVTEVNTFLERIAWFWRSSQGETGNAISR